tara:strand:- start:3456 stop:4019 length:564 start_codon:yes stop_codon:yes gene_type:complete
MKKFFTQPIGDLSRQNALTFLVINVVFIGVEFSGVTALDAVDDLLNFFWGFSLISIITAGYYLAEGHVPEYWKAATTVLATVIIFGTFLEITLVEDGFLPMYFFWAFNSLIYTLTLRGTGIFRPIYENITVLGAFIITIGSSADIFFGYELPEDFQIIGFVGWSLLVVGTSLGNYFAWGDKMSSSAE